MFSTCVTLFTRTSGKSKNGQNNKKVLKLNNKTKNNYQKSKKQYYNTNNGKQQRFFTSKVNVKTNTYSLLGALGLFGITTLLPASVYYYLQDEEDSNVLMQEDIQKFEQMVARLQKQNINKKGEAPIYRIVLTGGPCGGKSTAMAHISDRLSSLGFRVFRVPEAATLLITAVGLSPLLMKEPERITFEGTLLKTKIALEDAFYAIAKASGQPSVLICDRGTMDTQAYLTQETWDIVMDEFGWNVVDLRDKRYDGVIHMVTAAFGAEPYYTTENNAARHENLNEARVLDFKVLNAWIGHPKIRIIDNSTDFKGKISRVIDAVCQMIGAPRPEDAVRKFVINPLTPEELKTLPIKFETFEVEQTYLLRGADDPSEEKGYTYLRRRGQNGIYTYTLSSLRQPPGAQDTHQHIILERAVSGREYIALQRQGDPNRVVVRKRVRCFLWNNTYYELQEFLEPNIGLTILNTEVDASKEQANVTTPPFIKVQGEVTGRSEFSSYYISKHFRNDLKNTWEHDEKMVKAFTKTPTN